MVPCRTKRSRAEFAFGAARTDTSRLLVLAHSSGGASSVAHGSATANFGHRPTPAATRPSDARRVRRIESKCIARFARSGNRFAGVLRGFELGTSDGTGVRRNG